jgi:hypothetical protein
MEEVMALLKLGTYGNGWEVDLGDPSIKAEMPTQLVVTNEELAGAINMENVTDRIFARILKNRSKAHQMLLDKVPALKD